MYKRQEQDNLSAKQAVIEKLNAIDETLDKNEGLVQVRALMAEWAAIGHVPFKEKDKLRKQYQTALDSHFKRWNMKETRNRLDAFSNTVEAVSYTHLSGNKMIEDLERKIEKLKDDMQLIAQKIGLIDEKLQ